METATDFFCQSSPRKYKRNVHASTPDGSLVRWDRGKNKSKKVKELKTGFEGTRNVRKRGSKKQIGRKKATVFPARLFVFGDRRN
jgi:hypothetical protein